MSDEKELRELKEVGMSEVWSHEAHDFTPWLRDNISKLGKALNLKLYAKDIEVRIKNFSLDLLAEDEEGNFVAIENQFDRTDHSHLGQLLTYAAGCDAKILIWVTEHVNDEHRAAVEWLNRRTDIEMNFYLVKIEVFEIDDSARAYKFVPVVIANKWQKKLRKRLTTHTLEGQIRDEYYNQFMSELAEAKFPLTHCSDNSIPPCRLFSVGVRKWVIGHEVEGEHAEVYLWFRGENSKNVSILHEELSSYKELVNKKIDRMEWEGWWYRSCVGVASENSFSDSRKVLNGIRKWAVENMFKFAEVFTIERLKELEKKLEERENKIEE